MTALAALWAVLRPFLFSRSGLIAAGMIAVALGLLTLGQCSHRAGVAEGRGAEQAEQRQRSAETETEIRERQDENAADAAGRDVRGVLRDGAASHTAD